MDVTETADRPRTYRQRPVDLCRSIDDTRGLIRIVFHRAGAGWSEREKFRQRAMFNCAIE